MIPRLYDVLIRQHFENNDEMLFLMGPRQVGKTTASLTARANPDNLVYLNWDDQDHRLIILQGPSKIAELMQTSKLRERPPTVIFDELHKYPDWKNFLKGFYDSYRRQLYMIVTGSARLDVFRKGGDSLMGRYFYYRLHPLSVREMTKPTIPTEQLYQDPVAVDPEQFDALMEFGGFPAPFVKQDRLYYNRWSALKDQQLFQDDIRDLTRVQELAQMEVLARLVGMQAGQLSSYSSFAKKVRVSVDTIRRWIAILQSVYYCFQVRPWSKNVSRSLLKEPKYYLWDWSAIEGEGARLENFVASHLLKAVQFWSDHGFGRFELYFIRTKDQQEVDFLISKDDEPWFLVEVKLSGRKALSPTLQAFHKRLGTAHAFQVAGDMKPVEVDCFNHVEPVIVPLQTFLSQLM